MPRNITVHFSDGTAHQYNNAPDVLTPDDIEQRTKKDYPNKKIVRIDGGKKSDQPSELDQVKKNAGVTPTSPDQKMSEFSIKGIKFGMTKEQVEQISGGQTVGTGLGKFFGALSGYGNENNNYGDTHIRSLFGVNFNRPMGAKYSNGILVQLYMDPIDPNQAIELIDQFSVKFKKPDDYDRSPIQNRMGNSFPSAKAFWNDIQGASILISTSGGGGTVKWGYIRINDNKHLDKQIQQNRQQKQKNLGDI